MKKMKRKALFGFVFDIIEFKIFVICLIIIMIIGVYSLYNDVLVTIYMENITSSSMLAFTMLNSNLINKGRIDIPTRTCGEETLLPIKYIIGIGLCKSHPDAYDLGYYGYEIANVNLKDECINPYINSAYYRVGLHVYLFFIPRAIIPPIGLAEAYIYYNDSSCTDDICYSVKGSVLSLSPKDPKTTYAYIVLPNAKISRIVTKTS